MVLGNPFFFISAGASRCSSSDNGCGRCGRNLGPFLGLREVGEIGEVTKTTEKSDDDEIRDPPNTCNRLGISNESGEWRGLQFEVKDGTFRFDDRYNRVVREDTVFLALEEPSVRNQFVTEA